MNTAKELVEKYDIKEKTAERMIRTYQNHIGQRNGIYEITDMTYIGNREKDIELTCTSCNNVIHKRLKRSRWDELQKHCFCEKENRDSENFPKIKKAIRNDDKSYLGKVYGTLKVIDFEYYKTKKSGHKINWVCECKECKETKICIPSQLKNNKYKCVCQRSIEPLERDKYIGKKFNRLTINNYRM